MVHIVPAAGEQGRPVVASHHTWAFVFPSPFGFGLFIQVWGAGPFLGENTGIQQKHLFWTRLLYKSLVILWGCDRAKN